MESSEDTTRTPARDTRKNRVEAAAELARRLPDAHRVIDKLHTTWRALISRTTPAWKKVLVALEAARMTWEARKIKRDEEGAERSKPE